ncbi:nucleotidyltransferase domain-containing protein [Candidatus Pacearchaeota archaeon]|nr:nucleotidyltransferase domain-containing protein [Candidatus Pacearchaeota archaeon]
MEKIIEIGTVSSRGQIAIPAGVRRKLGIGDGEKVLFVLEGDILIVKKVQEDMLTGVGIKADEKSKTGNLTAKEIIKILNMHKSEINNYGVKKIGLFGSFAKGKQNEKSDVDILVEFSNASFDNYMGLKLFLEGLFGRSVDLIIEKGLKPELNYIKKEVIYA